MTVCPRGCKKNYLAFIKSSFKRLKKDFTKILLYHHGIASMKISANRLKYLTSIVVFILLTLILVEVKADLYVEKKSIPHETVDPNPKILKGLLDIDINFIYPFLWGGPTTGPDIYKSILSNKVHHPLILGKQAFAWIYFGIKNMDQEMLMKGKRVLDIIDNYPNVQEFESSILYMYGFDHGGFKKNKWWSAMANASIAMAYLLAYDYYKDDHYLLKAKKAIAGVFLEVGKGGSAIKVAENANWYLEYADTNRVYSNAYFVLNGFTFSLVALKAFHLRLGVEEYEDAYENGKNALRMKSNEFFFNDKSWFYYMLNPMTIESTHYAIYDLMLFDSLRIYDDDPIIQKNIDIRRNTIRKEYGVKRVSQDGYFFSAIGAPHPYWPDIYPTKLEVHYSDSTNAQYNLFPRNYKKKSQDERLFLQFNSKGKKIDKIIVKQLWGNLEYELFKQRKVPSRKMIENVSSIRSQKQILFNGELVSNNKLVLQGDEINSKKRIKTSLRFIFDTPVNLYSQNYFGLIVKNEMKLSTIKIVLINTKGKVFKRYYLPQEKTDVENLILVKGMSFPKYELVENKELKEVRFQFIINEIIKTEMTIQFSELLIFPDELLVRNILGENEKSNISNIYFKEKIIPPRSVW
jgi:hypothetical protein